MIVYKEDLDLLKCDCGVPACEEEVVLHSKCHTDKPTWAYYYNGNVRIVCSECDEEIITIPVASREKIQSQE